MAQNSRRRESYKKHIQSKHPSDDLINAEPAIESPLIEMAAMSLRDRFTTDETTHQRDGRIRQIIERQQYRRCKMTATGKECEQPAQQ